VPLYALRWGTLAGLPRGTGDAGGAVGEAWPLAGALGGSRGRTPERQRKMPFGMPIRPNHGTICVNLTACLVPQLRGSPCRVFSKDTKVLFGPMPRTRGSRQGLFAYPDLVVVCGTMQFHDAAQDVLLNPTGLIEVLSPSTEGFDRGEKFQRYRHWLPTLTDYVLVAQHQPVMDHYHRTAANRWELVAYEDLEARLELEAIGCTVPLAEVYERVEFPSEEEPS
jgi:Uma2 family endonuclease